MERIARRLALLRGARVQSHLNLALCWAASFGLLALLSFFTLRASSAKTPSCACGTEGHWVNYTNVDHVRAIAVENVGTERYAWVATDGGVACWNLEAGICASYTTASGLRSNDVLCVGVDEHGHKWFGTSAGVSVFTHGYTTPWDLSDDVWQHYSMADGLISNRVQAIGFSRGSAGVEYKWLGTDRGVTVLSDTLHTRSYATADGMTASYVTAIAVSNTTEVWCGTNSGITVFSGNDPLVTATLTTYTISNTVTLSNTGLASNRIRQIACGEGEVWVATEGGLSRRSADSTWYHYPPNADNGLPCPEALAVALDGQGNAWLVLGNGQVTVFRPRDPWPIFSTADGLPPGGATTVVFDGQQRMLFGTAGGGMGALDAQGTPYEKGDDQWRAYRSGWGPISNELTSLAVATGTLLCGTWGSGASVSSTVWTHYTYSDGLGSNYVSAVALDVHGHPWFGTQRAGWEGMAGGLSVLVTPTWATYIYSDISPLAYAFSVATWGENQVWVGTDQGAVWIDHQGTPLRPSNALTTTFTLDGLLASGATHVITPVLAIHVAPGASHVWFGTTGGLILLDHHDTLLAQTDDIWITYTVSDGLASNHVYDVVLDEQGYVWAATDRGLSVLDDNGTPWDKADDRWQTFLSDVWVRGIARDRDGCWWLATAQGAYRFCDGGTPLDQDDDIWEAFTAMQGLAGNDVYDVAMDPATGHMWFATRHGLSEFILAPSTPTPTPTVTETSSTEPGVTPTPSSTATLHRVFLPTVLKHAALPGSF